MVKIGYMDKKNTLVLRVSLFLTYVNLEVRLYGALNEDILCSRQKQLVFNQDKYIQINTLPQINIITLSYLYMRQ